MHRAEEKALEKADRGHLLSVGFHFFHDISCTWFTLRSQQSFESILLTASRRHVWESLDLRRQIWCLLYFVRWKGLPDWNVPKDVALHGEQEAVCFRIHVRRGNEARDGRQLRLPDGIHDSRLRRPAQLQPDPDRWPARLERLRHRYTERYYITFPGAISISYSQFSLPSITFPGTVTLPLKVESLLATVPCYDFTLQITFFYDSNRFAVAWSNLARHLGASRERCHSPLVQQGNQNISPFSRYSYATRMRNWIGFAFNGELHDCSVWGQ